MIRNLLTLLTIISLGGYAQNKLFIPPTIQDTNVIDLNLQLGTYEFFPGITTNTMGANGNLLGPTLILNQGDSITIKVHNNIGEPTTMHWHGMHVSAPNDGGPHTVIDTGTTWTPSFTVRDKAGTYWYHPHLHKRTDLHVSKGIAGLIIVRDTEEAKLPLPRTYGVDDIPVIIQTKGFDANYQIVAHTNSDTVLVVNGIRNPYIDLPAQVVRLRILNGSSQRVFNLGLSDNSDFFQIATDGGLLQQPLQTKRLMLSPGERAEILINLTGRKGDTLFLMSYASELPNGIYGAKYPGIVSFMTLNGYDPNPMNGNDFNILQINVIDTTQNPIFTIPNTLVQLTPLDPTTANVTRTLTFAPEQMGPNQLNGKFTINGTFFDMNVINYIVPINNVEIWELTNQSAIAHPFHIHGVQFYILDRNGNPPPPSEQGRKDVVLVKPQETVRFITKFENFANDTVPYMYHCHMLTHEDSGMMGQFLVINNPSAILNLLNKQIIVYPNPNDGNFFIASKTEITEIEIYNLLGQKIPFNSEQDKEHHKIYGLTRGVYIIRIKTKDGKLYKEKVVVN